MTYPVRPAGSRAVTQHGAAVGRFIWDLVSDEWRWSDQMYDLHGYAPNDVQVTTALWLQHKHPDFRAGAEAELAAAALDPEPLSFYHRILTADGAQRTVLTVHHGTCDDSGRRCVRRVGFMVDVTEGERRAVRDTLLHLAPHRSEIEQAKGMLMLAYRLDGDQAFALLRWHSNQHNRKLHAVARHLVQAVSGLAPSSAPTRATLDELLFDIARAAELPTSPDPRPIATATAEGSRPAAPSSTKS